MAILPVTSVWSGWPWPGRLGDAAEVDGHAVAPGGLADGAGGGDVGRPAAADGADLQQLALDGRAVVGAELELPGELASVGVPLVADRDRVRRVDAAVRLHQVRQLAAVAASRSPPVVGDVSRPSSLRTVTVLPASGKGVEASWPLLAAAVAEVLSNVTRRAVGCRPWTTGPQGPLANRVGRRLDDLLLSVGGVLLLHLVLVPQVEVPLWPAFRSSLTSYFCPEAGRFVRCRGAGRGERHGRGNRPDRPRSRRTRAAVGRREAGAGHEGREGVASGCIADSGSRSSNFSEGAEGCQVGPHRRRNRRRSPARGGRRGSEFPDLRASGSSGSRVPTRPVTPAGGRVRGGFKSDLNFPNGSCMMCTRPHPSRRFSQGYVSLLHVSRIARANSSELPGQRRANG